MANPIFPPDESGQQSAPYSPLDRLPLMSGSQQQPGVTPQAPPPVSPLLQMLGMFDRPAQKQSDTLNGWNAEQDRSALLDRLRGPQYQDASGWPIAPNGPGGHYLNREGAMVPLPHHSQIFPRQR